MTGMDVGSVSVTKPGISPEEISPEELEEGKQQQTDFKGQKVKVTSNNVDSFKQAIVAGESIGAFRQVRATQKRTKKERVGKKKSDSKKEGEKKAETRIGGIAEVAAVEPTKRDRKRKDPFFRYRGLKQEKEKLSEEAKQAKAEKLKELENKINSITEQMDQLYEKNKMIIDSGFEISETVAAEAKALQDKGIAIDEFDIHQGYRDAVLDYGNLKDTYFKLMDTYKEENILDGIRITISALARDLHRVEKQNVSYKNKVTNLTIDKNRLKIIMQELYKMKNLHTFYLRSEENLAKYVSDKVSISHLRGKCLELMEKNWADAYDVTALSQEIGVKNSDPKVLSFLNDLLALLKSVPNENLYSSGVHSTEEVQNAINEKRDEGAKAENKIASPSKRA